MNTIVYRLGVKTVCIAETVSIYNNAFKLKKKF